MTFQFFQLLYFDAGRASEYSSIRMLTVPENDLEPYFYLEKDLKLGCVLRGTEPQFNNIRWYVDGRPVRYLRHRKCTK